MPIHPALSEKLFITLSKRYFKRWKANLILINSKGKALLIHGACCGESCRKCRAQRLKAVKEAMRWGEPIVDFGPHNKLVWAVPVTINNQLAGGLIAEISDQQVFPHGHNVTPIDVKNACQNLMEMAVEANLTNEALLRANQERNIQERLRAEAIHAYKQRPHSDMREIYLHEEPALLDAIRKGDRNTARGILNNILIAIHFQAEEPLELLKSFSMELIIMMCRTAVETGGIPETLLGADYEEFLSVARFKSEEELLGWLSTMLDRLMDSLENQPRDRRASQIHTALDYMRRNFANDISRESTAQEAGMSCSHFSREFKKFTGRTFSDQLNQLRVDQACMQLARTEKPIVAITFECGFSDQSYFHKVFRRYTGLTPAAYRKTHQKP